MATGKMTKKNGDTDLRKKHDWEPVKTDYVEGMLDDHGQHIWPTALDLANKYDIGVEVIRKKCASSRWLEQRNAYKTRLDIERQQQMVKAMAGKAVILNEEVYNTASDGIELIKQRFEFLLSTVGSELDPSRLSNLKHRVAMGETLTKADFHGLVYHKEMESLANALNKLHDTGLKALGIKDTDQQQITVNTQVNQVMPSQEMMRPDKERAAAILSIFQRKNTSIPSFMQERIEQQGGIVVDQDNTIIEYDEPLELESGVQAEDEDGTA